MQAKTLTGTVERFKGNGRKLGYPTANLKIKTELKDGVYFGVSDLAEFSAHPSVIFIGTPTTMGDKERRVEVHLLDIPDVDYYDQQLAVSPQHYHRSNKTFDSVNELLEVMKADEQNARQWFANSGSGRP